MSIDYYTCYVCGNTFPDCGNYVRCDNENCYAHWCCDKCASKDDATESYCKLDRYYEDFQPEDPELCDEEYCEECSEFEYGGCDYCRGLNYEDDELLRYALKELGIDRSGLIEKYNESKGVENED